MSNIIVDIPNIPGDTSYTIGATSYANHIGCKSITHAIDLSFTVAHNARTTSASTHGPIGLMHDFDVASPLLRAAAAAGTMVGTADIHRLDLSGGTANIAETINLTGVYVVRIDLDSFVDGRGLPTDSMLETFWLEYDTITWDYKYQGSSISRSWNLSTLSS